MVFEYDANKSAENKRKHGIDFDDAQRLWADPGVMEIPARTSDEPRWLLIGKIDEKHIGTDPKRVNVDFPAWMVDSLDREARRLISIPSRGAIGFSPKCRFLAINDCCSKFEPPTENKPVRRRRAAAASARQGDPEGEARSAE
jgi:Ribonuclease toxin, BrnT, of type II toxin-antitoxin system